MSATIENFAMISHEFKTPISTIKSSLEVIKKYYEAGKIYDIDFSAYLDSLNANCSALTRLTNNIIDYAMSMSVAAFMSVNFREFLSEIESSVYSCAPSLDFEIIWQGAPTEDFEIALDADKITRVLMNLISNTLKYVSRDAKCYLLVEPNTDYLRLEYGDNGSGIPEKWHEKVFEPFFQIDSSLTRQQNGSGLGLAIVKKLIELHDGSIKIVPKDITTVFEIILPYNLEKLRNISQKHEPQKPIYIARVELGEFMEGK